MDFTSITNSWGYILSGAAYTVQLTAITAVGGLFLGTLLALCHISEKRWLSAPAKLYINLMRAVPLVLVLFEAAYFAEIMRAGIQSVKKGQIQAAYGLGLSYAQTMRHVVLPQAIRHMLPVLLTQTIILFQDTSLVYVISGNDFMGSISKIAQRDGQLVLMYSFAAVCYLAVSLSLSLLIRRLQTRMRTAQAH